MPHGQMCLQTPGFPTLSAPGGEEWSSASTDRSLKTETTGYGRETNGNFLRILIFNHFHLAIQITLRMACANIGNQELARGVWG